MLCFVFGLTVLPLAEATAIAFAAPMFVTLLSVPLLGERVERLPLIAAVVGFWGVLVVVRPGSQRGSSSAPWWWSAPRSSMHC